MQTASRPSACISKGCPSRPTALTVIPAERVTSAKMPGTERQPSWQTCSPERSVISGLMNTSGWSCSSDTSITMKRWWTSTWLAARPMPGAAYLVSNMSSRSRWNSGVVTRATSTGAATVRRRGSGNSRMGSWAMAGKWGCLSQTQATDVHSSAQACLEPCNGAYFLGYSALPVSVYDARAHLKGSQVHTMLKPIRAVVAAALLAIATYAVAAELRGDHPDTYVVQKGDTLWDIAGRFLERPWLWPEIWQANPQIANPHLIYPGDVVSLAYLDRVAAAQVQPGPRAASPVTGVPLGEIEPFLKDLRVVDAFEHLPYVVGLEDNRLRSSEGQVAYVKGLADAEPGQRYAVVRPIQRYTRLDRTACCDLFHRDTLDFRGKRHLDFEQMWTNAVVPDNGHELLGYELMRQATGTVSRGEVGGIEAATFLLDKDGREVRVGDRLIPVEAQPYDLQFFPHPPRQQFEYGRARVLAVADMLRTGGPR